MKAQATIVGVVLITGIMIAIITAVFVWGRPLIDKVLDRTHFNVMIDKMKEIDKAIIYVAQTESSQKVEVNFKENEYTQINSNGEILFKSVSRIPVFGSKTWVPLNAYGLPRQYEIITTNTTATYCQTCAAEEYPATYSFTDDNAGSNPSGWTIVEPVGTSIEVLATLGGHGKVVNLTNTGTGVCHMTSSTFTQTTTGTIQFWIRSANNTPQQTFYLRNGGTEVIILQIVGGSFKYYDTGYHIIQDCTNNVWYHIKIDFNAVGWQIAINDAQYGGSYAYGYYNAIGSGATNIRFLAEEANTEFYVDAIDYSWNSGMAPCCGDDFTANNIPGIVSDGIVKYGNITIENVGYNLLVLNLSSNYQYGKVCINNSAVSDGDCAFLNGYITKGGISHKILFINESGTEVIIQGAERDVVGLLGKDEPGILVGKSIESESFFEINMKLVYRTLVDSSGRLYKYIISCPNNCIGRSGNRALKITFDRIDRRTDRTDMYIKTSFE